MCVHCGSYRPFLLHVGNASNTSQDDHETRSMDSPLRRRRRKRSPSPTYEEKSGSNSEKRDSCLIDAEPHPDEHQIKLDTDRSFVLYSVGEPFIELNGIRFMLTENCYEDELSREELQSRLNGLITSVFRRHPRLSYFQVGSILSFVWRENIEIFPGLS